MAFLSGIFGNQQPQQQQQAQQGQPSFPQQGTQGQQPPQQQQHPVGGTQPASAQQQPANSQYAGAGQNPQNPLDPFLQLLTPSEDAIKQQQQQQQLNQQGLFGQVKPEDLQAHASKIDFSQAADPQKVQAALSGDVNAFKEVINGVMQQAFTMNLQMMQGMVEHGVKTGNERFSSTLDSRFRDLQLMNKNSENQALQHPIGKALLGTIKRQIAQANPKMHADEIHAKAEEMFTQFSSLMTAKPGSQEAQQSQGMDWTAFLDQ